MLQLSLATLFLGGLRMKLEELISGKGNGESIMIGKASLPVSALKQFMSEGYVHIRPYEPEGAFSLWGETCTGCFTEEQIRERA